MKFLLYGEHNSYRKFRLRFYWFSSVFTSCLLASPRFLKFILMSYSTIILAGDIVQPMKSNTMH